MTEGVTVTILDTMTGYRVTCTDYDTWYWEESNGACDCNRCWRFEDGGIAIPRCPDCRDWGNGWGRGKHVCCGAQRFLIAEASAGDVAVMNEDYPAELVAKWLPKRE